MRSVFYVEVDSHKTEDCIHQAGKEMGYFQISSLDNEIFLSSFLISIRKFYFLTESFSSFFLLTFQQRLEQVAKPHHSRDCESRGKAASAKRQLRCSTDGEFGYLVLTIISIHSC